MHELQRFPSGTFEGAAAAGDEREVRFALDLSVCGCHSVIRQTTDRWSCRNVFPLFRSKHRFADSAW